MKYLLDTNIVSRIYRRDPHPMILSWLKSKILEEVYISSISIAEIHYGIELSRRKHPAIQSERLTYYLNEMMRLHYGRILPFEEVAAQYWGRLMSHDSNHPLDAQIAAVALAHDAVLVTSDQGFHQFVRRLHQENVKLRVLDPLTTT